MARFPVQNIESATGSNKENFAAFKKALGLVPNVARDMGTSPAVLQGYAQFLGALSGGKLSAQLREQIALLTAQNNACTYCLSAHTALGKMAGLNQSQIDSARTGHSDDPRSAAALRFAQAVIDVRGGVGDGDVRAVRAAGFSDAEIAEIVGAVGLNYFTNIFNKAFDVDVDFPRVEAREMAAAR